MKTLAFFLLAVSLLVVLMFYGRTDAIERHLNTRLSMIYQKEDVSVNRRSIEGICNIYSFRLSESQIDKMVETIPYVEMHGMNKIKNRLYEKSKDMPEEKKERFIEYKLRQYGMTNYYKIKVSSYEEAYEMARKLVDQLYGENSFMLYRATQGRFSELQEGSYVRLGDGGINFTFIPENIREDGVYKITMELDICAGVVRTVYIDALKPGQSRKYLQKKYKEQEHVFGKIDIDEKLLRHAHNRVGRNYGEQLRAEDYREGDSFIMIDRKVTYREPVREGTRRRATDHSIVVYYVQEIIPNYMEEDERFENLLYLRVNAENPEDYELFSAEKYLLDRRFRVFKDQEKTFGELDYRFRSDVEEERDAVVTEEKEKE